MFEELVEIAGEVALEAAGCFASGLAFLEASFEVGDRGGVCALVATEVMFASDVLGAGVEWETVTGYSDTETISILRDFQRKLVGQYRSLHS